MCKIASQSHNTFRFVCFCEHLGTMGVAFLNPVPQRVRTAHGDVDVPADAGGGQAVRCLRERVSVVPERPRREC